MSEISLRTLQKQMMNYLTDDKPAIAEHVVEHGGISRDVRLHIYKNAYQIFDIYTENTIAVIYLWVF